MASARNELVLAVLATLALAASGAPADPIDTLPDFFPKRVCRRSDKGAVLNDCIKQNMQEIVPLLRTGGRLSTLPALEPFQAPSVETNLRSPLVDLHYVFGKLSVKGMTNVQVQNARANLRNDTMDFDLDLFFPKSVYGGVFEVKKGRVATWPFKGKGPVEITFDAINATWKFQGKRQAGGKYMSVTRVTPTYTVGGMKVWGRDLVEGHPNLDQLLFSIVNRFWAQFVELGKPLMQKELSDNIQVLANGVFNSVPYDLIFPE